MAIININSAAARYRSYLTAHNADSVTYIEFKYSLRPKKSQFLKSVSVKLFKI